jgi:hypothetical protein
MAITDFQRGVCRLIAKRRVELGESYVAGGVALNTLLARPRVSADRDLFHDTEAALAATWESDRQLLAGAGYALEVVRERPTFVEAVVRRQDQLVVLQWVCDSAYRFFPLVEHPDFGLTLHPFDLATNKVLALVGRVEVRDWIDVISCHDHVQPLGYLAWSACGKDPGYNPAMILAEARRSGRYTQAEAASLAFDGPVPDVPELSRRWHAMLREAEQVIDLLPVDHVGECVLGSNGSLYTGGLVDLERTLDAEGLSFHEGRIRGALPSIVTR